MAEAMLYRRRATPEELQEGEKQMILAQQRLQEAVDMPIEDGCIEDTPLVVRGGRDTQGPQAEQTPGFLSYEHGPPAEQTPGPYHQVLPAEDGEMGTDGERRSGKAVACNLKGILYELQTGQSRGFLMVINGLGAKRYIHISLAMNSCGGLRSFSNKQHGCMEMKRLQHLVDIGLQDYSEPGWRKRCRGSRWFSKWKLE